MPQILQGTNAAALAGVDDAYILIQPPNSGAIPNAQTNVLGFGGSATWGALNVAAIIGSGQDLVTNYGSPTTATYDMPTDVNNALRSGANNVRAFRISDGTDVAAVLKIPDTAAAFIATLTGRFTGSLPNATTNSPGSTVRVDTGSNSTTVIPSFRVTISFPNVPAEVYDNIVGGAASAYVAATFIANVVNAINGTPALSALRPASAFYVATAGASAISPLLATNTPLATLGADGSTFATAAVATTNGLGSDTAIPKTGMYSLSGVIGGGLFALSGNTDLVGTGSAAVAFAQRENAIFVGSFPTGTSTLSALTIKQTSGIASYSAFLVKDFSEFTDNVNNVINRRVSSTAFMAARTAVTSPETSPANQRINIITGTERTGAVLQSPYSPAELFALEAAGINVITNPVPGGNYFGIRHNKNSLGASDPRGNMAYSRMTQFIAQSLNSILLGGFVGLAQSRQPNDPVRARARALLSDFFQPLLDGGVIDSFQIACDLRNNTPATIASGVLRADITVVYLAIVDKFIASLTGGQTVSLSLTPGTVTAQT